MNEDQEEFQRGREGKGRNLGWQCLKRQGLRSSFEIKVATLAQAGLVATSKRLSFFSLSFKMVNLNPLKRKASSACLPRGREEVIGTAAQALIEQVRKQHRTKQNEAKQNETKRSETKGYETKRNETKRDKEKGDEA